MRPLGSTKIGLKCLLLPQDSSAVGGGGEFDIRHKEPCLGLRLYASHNLNSWRVKHFSKCQRADQITNVFMSSKAVKDRNRGNLFTW